MADGLLEYNSDTFAGVSGAPVWRIEKKGLYLVGIHKGMRPGRGMNRPVPLVAQLLDQYIKPWMIADKVLPKF